MRHLINRLSVVCFSLGLAACAQFSENSTGVENGSLTDCPAWPRCASSLAVDSEKRVPAYLLKAPVADNWQKLVATVRALENTRIVSSSTFYLHAEVTSPWGWYTDDLELLLDADSGRVDVRSSARIGYYDFAVNRERLEALRIKLASQGIIARH